MSPKRGPYPTELREAAVRMLLAGREPEDLSQEIGVPPGTLRVWLYFARGGVRGPGSREDVIAQTVEAFEQLDKVLQGLPDNVLETLMPFAAGAIDPWRLKDAVAHVTHYKAREVWRLARGSGNGEAPTVTVPSRLADYFEWTRWRQLAAADPVMATMDERTMRRHGPNHLVFELWRDRPAGEVLAWHRQVHDDVVSILKEAPEGWFGLRPYGSPRTPRVSVSALAGHLGTHLRDIRRLLAAKQAR